MTSILLGVFAGICFGAVIALLKYKIQWGTFLNKKQQQAIAAQNKISDAELAAIKNRILIGVVIGTVVNLLAILAIFLLRDILPFDWVSCMFAAATILAFGPKIVLSIRGLRDKSV